MKIWIDLDNSPHVLFFAPIIRELEASGIESIITVRESAQTEDLARLHGMKFVVIGKHYPTGNISAKIAGTFGRALQLARYIRKEKVSIAVSHGSRAMVLAAYGLRIPIITLYDYEFASYRLYNMLSDRLLAPFIIPVDRLVAQGLDPRKLTPYPGLKEEAYVYGFRPDQRINEAIGRDPSKRLITVRPPATWAHYHNQRSEVLFDTLLKRLDREPDVQVIVLARNLAQEKEILLKHKLDPKKFMVSCKAVDGLSLMWNSAAVFSGGGTMTREAALLGLNVYSVFGGQIGAGDEYLVSQGRLHIFQDPAQLEGITFDNGSENRQVPPDKNRVAFFISEEIRRFAMGGARA